MYIYLLLLIILLINIYDIDSFTDTKKCCLVEKKIIPNFHYTYTPLENEQCKILSNSLYIEGINNWDNKNCKENYLGSCRRINKECVDFVDKDFCDKYKMTWSEKTCNEPIPFVWKDTINLPKPNINNGVVRMF